MASVGSIIYGSDYNAVRVKVDGILGTGAYYAGPTNGYGYNQTVASALVNPNDVITAAQWNNLANDLNKCYLHQTGTNFPGYTTISGQITYANLTTLDGIANTIVSNRLNIGSNQFTQSLLRTDTRSAAWSTSISTGIRLDWSSTNNMWYFFNQGGSFKLQGIVPSGSSTPQDLSWRTLMQNFNYTTTFANFQGAWNIRSNKNNALVVYSSSGSTPYQLNTVTVAMTIISELAVQLFVQYNDAHTATGGGPDSVSAGIGCSTYRNIASSAFNGTPQSTVTNTFTFG